MESISNTQKQHKISYNTLSKYYWEILKETDKNNQFKKIMNFFVTKYSLKKNESILDLACGAGGALSCLERLRFKNLFGVDLSEEMIYKAKKTVSINCQLYNKDWLTFLKAFENYFNLIYSLRISLLHAERYEIEALFKSVYRSLNCNSYFIFDTRDWLNKNNRLIERNRVIGKYRKIYILRSLNVLIEDCCTYKNNRQKISYRISDLTSRKIVNKFYVSYLIISVEEIKKVLLNVGFIEINSFKHDNWPYHILSCKKGIK